MSSGPSTNPAPTSGTGTTGGGGGSSKAPLPSVSAGRLKTAASSPFTMPPGTHLEALTGQNWNVWSGVLSAILELNEVDSILSYDSVPSGVDQDDWSSIQKKTKAYLRLYCALDVYSTVESDVDYPSFKDKYDHLRDTYGGVGSTAVFNLWIELTQARLDEGSPLAPQLAKLNEARVKLSNASMGVSDIQYCLILLHALPRSYEVVASTLLASGPASSLKHSEIIARVLNEEGRKSGPSTSLNAARAPIKSGKKKKKDHSNLTCHYCNKKGHIQPDCRKKKKDEADKKKDDGNADSGKKAANAHVLIPNTASIEEVNDELNVALYAAASVRWMMDSGATHHMSPHRSDFADYSQCHGTVRLGDKSTVDQVGVGSVVVKTSRGTRITLANVLHIPEIKTRFLSTCALVQRGATVLFDQGSFKIAVNQRCIASGYLEHNLYWLDASMPALNVHMRSAATPLHIWHQRMGHMSHMALKAHGPSATTGMDIDASAMAIPNACHGCEVGKSARKPFSGSGKGTSQIFEVVHSDLAGPMQTTSIQGSSYIATFIDDHSRYAVIYFLKSKDQFVQALKKFLVWGETQTSLKLRALHSDRGGEYIAGTVTELLSEKGIERHLTMPGSPQQNGKAERFNRTVMDKAMAMLHAAGLSPGFWECAVQTAQHIYNRSPTRTLSWRTPYELWNCGQVPDVSYLRVFGCKGYMHVPADKRRKLDAKAVEVTLVGYEAGAKGYQLWDKHTHSLRLSRDVTFDESSFLYPQSVEPHSAPVSSAPSSARAPIIPSPDTAAPNPAAVPPPVLPVARAPTPDSPTDSEDSVRNLLRPTTEPTESERPSERPHTPPTPSTPLSALTTLPSTPERPSATLSTLPPRCSATRVVNRPPSPLANPPEGYVDRMQRAQFLREMANVPWHSARAPVPNPRYFGADNVAQRGRRLGYAELLAVAHVGRDPATYAEAMRTADVDDWTKACQYEMDALAKNATWELVDLPPGRKAVKSKWVFNVTYRHEDTYSSVVTTRVSGN